MTRAIADRTGVDFEQISGGRRADPRFDAFAEPEEIASVIAFLCSDDARFVSGQVIYVRGGPLV